jgi:hypothetical protein
LITGFQTHFLQKRHVVAEPFYGFDGAKCGRTVALRVCGSETRVLVPVDGGVTHFTVGFTI